MPRSTVVSAEEEKTLEQKLKPGRGFEEAVYAFARKLDPNAEILFDHYVPDRDTGTPRQCDVWINGKISGHWPIPVYVSCKDTGKRKLDIGDIDCFIGEMASRGASTGVIYSHRGFSEPAIAKAKARSIPCCRLYRNEPPDIPNLISFTPFVCMTSMKIELSGDYKIMNLATWGDLFNCHTDEEPSRLLLDVIHEVYREGEKVSLAQVSETAPFPPAWKTDLEFRIGGAETPVIVSIYGFWRRYQGLLKAHLLNGSYCITDNSFIGEQKGPSIDTWGTHPGEGWVQLKDDEAESPPLNSVVAILFGSDAKNTLVESLAAKPLPFHEYSQEPTEPSP